MLFVEDEPIIGGFVRDRLEDEGYLAELVGTVAEVRQRIASHPPALILCDLMLPVEDGWGFLAAR